MRTTIIATNQPFRFRSMVAASGIGLSPFRPAVETAARCLGEASRSAPRLRLVHDAGEKAAVSPDGAGFEPPHFVEDVPERHAWRRVLLAT